MLGWTESWSAAVDCGRPGRCPIRPELTPWDGRGLEHVPVDEAKVIVHRMREGSGWGVAGRR